MKIVEYKIISGSENEVGGKIYDLLKEGWQPQGSISTVKNNGGTIKFSQAMVKYNEPLDK